MISGCHCHTNVSASRCNNTMTVVGREDKMILNRASAFLRYRTRHLIHDDSGDVDGMALRHHCYDEHDDDDDDGNTPVHEAADASASNVMSAMHGQ